MNLFNGSWLIWRWSYHQS